MTRISIHKKTKTLRKHFKPKEPTIDNDEKDGILTSAEKNIREVIAWVQKTESGAGGINKWHEENIENGKELEPVVGKVGEANKEKNRNQEIICIDKTRVKLQDVPEGKDYIHANLIKINDHDRTYIATQHPDDANYEDFWRMVFYENVDTIIAVYSPDEVLPCYFPNELEKYAYHGKFFVNCRKVIPAASKYCACQYYIEVLPEGCSNSRFVTLVHYQYWPKGMLPANPRVILKMLRLIKVDKMTNGPTLVHCHNGINRAGCIILTDVLTNIVFRGITPDFANLVKTIRTQRHKFLQNKIYLHYAIFSFMEYVKIRCKKFKMLPDIIKDIEAYQLKVKPDFQPITAKEPKKANNKETAEE